MSRVARLIVSLVAAAFLLLFAAGSYADSYTVTFSGTAPDGTSFSGTLNPTARPDGLGDGGFAVTSISAGTLNLEGSTYTVTGLTPLNGVADPLNSKLNAFFICAFPPNNCGVHFDSYDNLLFPADT